jgi:hypothetical protein
LRTVGAYRNAWQIRHFQLGYRGGSLIQSYSAPESLKWKRACQAAFAQDVLAACMQRPAHLMSFHQVSQQLKLGNVRSLDPPVVALNQVVGSVDRYHDFNRAFLPMLDGLQDRW